MGVIHPMKIGYFYKLDIFIEYYSVFPICQSQYLRNFTALSKIKVIIVFVGSSDYWLIG